MASEVYEKLRAVIARNAATGPPQVDAMRAAIEATAMPLPDGVSGESVTANGVPCEWQTAEGAGDPVVLYVHGGGYVAGSIASHRNLTGHLAKTSGVRVLSVEYRLAPENPHPAPVDDAVAVYRWLLDQGTPSGKIAIAGDSAGGGLTIATLLALKDRGLPMPAAAVPISPWVDMQARGESFRTRADVDPMVQHEAISHIASWFLGPDGDVDDPLASPIEGDLSGLPPLLIQVGDHETLLSDSEALAARAEAAGVDVTLRVWPEMIHVWHTLAGMCPEADAGISEAAAFLNTHLTGR